MTIPCALRSASLASRRVWSRRLWWDTHLKRKWREEVNEVLRFSGSQCFNWLLELTAVTLTWLVKIKIVLVDSSMSKYMASFKSDWTCSTIFPKGNSQGINKVRSIYNWEALFLQQTDNQYRICHGLLYIQNVEVRYWHVVIVYRFYGHMNSRSGSIFPDHSDST